MNKNLAEAIDNAGKADALMYAIESCYLDFEITPEEAELAERGVATFYALWDVVKEIRANLYELDGDRRVVDVIYAINDVRRQNSTLTDED